MTLRRPVIPDWPNEKFASGTSRRRLAGGNHNPVSAMELRAGIEPAAFRLRNGYSARLSYRSACQPPENVEVSRHSAAVWPDVFSHGTDERQPLWAVPDALSQPGSVGSFRKGDWSRSTDSNREPAAYKTAALPLRYCGTFPPAAISRQDGPCRVHRRRKATGGQRRFLFETTDTEANRMPLALGHAAVDCAAGIRTVPKCDSRSH